MLRLAAASLDGWSNGGKRKVGLRSPGDRGTAGVTCLHACAADEGGGRGGGASRVAGGGRPRRGGVRNRRLTHRGAGTDVGVAAGFCPEPDRGRGLPAGRQLAGGHRVRLSGKTLGIVGLGKIGTRIAGYGRAFGMDVLAWSQNLTEETAAAAGARRVSKEELFTESDVVSLHLRLSPRSEGTVGERELQLLGPEGVLVNTARGPLVDQQALVTALQEGWIRGAAIDVFDEEPLPAGHQLLAAPRDPPDAPPWLCHAGELPGVLRRRVRGRDSLAGRRPGPDADPVAGYAGAGRRPYAAG